jgi:hypothetical protein
MVPTVGKGNLYPSLVTRQCRGPTIWSQIVAFHEAGTTCYNFLPRPRAAMRYMIQNRGLAR